MNAAMLKTGPGTSILRNTLWMAWSGAINIANSVVLWMALARWRTTAEVGQFATVMSLYTIFITVCGLGLTPYLASELARRPDRRRFLSSAALLIFAASIVCTLAMLVTGQFTNQAASAQTATFILSSAIIPTGIVSIGEAVFTAFGLARVIALATTTENLLRTIIPLALLYRGHSLPVICASFVLVRVAACMVYGLAAWQRFGLPALPEQALIREIAKAAPTFAGVTLLASLHWQLGTVLTARLGGETAAADFAVAARFLVPAMILLWSYVSVIQPTAARLAQESMPKLGEFLASCLRLVLALALPVAVGGLTLGMHLLVLLFGANYAGASLALGFLAASIVPFGIVMIASRGLIATQRQHLDLLANLVAVVVNLLANLLLIPRFGAAGAACAQFLSLTAMAVVEVRWGTVPLFSLRVWEAFWLCRWPLAVMLDVILLSYNAGFGVSLALGGISYLLGLAWIWPQLKPNRGALTAAQPVQPKPRVLMLGAHPTKTLGGISTLISDILGSSLTREFEFKHVVSQMDEGGKFAKLTLMLGALLRFGYILLRWRPDVVYVHVGGNASLYRKGVFITLARLAGWRVLAHFHAGNFAPYFNQQSWFGKQCILRGLGLSRKFIAVSQEMAGWLSELWPVAEITVIPNGVRTELFAPPETHLVVRQAASLSKSPGKTEWLNDDASTSWQLAGQPSPRLLFIGKMGFLKGEGDLLRALQIVKAEYGLSFRLDLLGQLSGEIGALCQTTGLASQIDQLGPVALTERIGYFQRADIFVLPTYAEGMPIAVIEALAAGLPCVTTPVGGIPELMRDGQEGFLIEPGDIRTLAARLAQLLREAELRQAMGARALQTAARFDLKHVLARLGDELRQEAEATGLSLGTMIEKSSN
ncbi:MAG: glycosyltransferase [Acidobacteria bacterium]|nr:glycosyltransferase [Acidobacteriota bacterium]MBI3422578.1 glycosyltransferase [Acidobacteriota bacterium]